MLKAYEESNLPRRAKGRRFAWLRDRLGRKSGVEPVTVPKSARPSVGIADANPHLR